GLAGPTAPVARPRGGGRGRSGRAGRAPSQRSSRGLGWLRRGVALDRLLLRAIRRDGPDAGEHAADFLRQRDAVLPLFRGQLVELRRLEEARQVRVTQPAPNLPHAVAGPNGITVERLVPGGQVRPQPLPRLLPPARPLGFPHAREILAAATAYQGGRAGGAEAAAGPEVLRQGRVGSEGVGVEAG